MGVYINMEMPTSCYYCPFADGSWGYSPPHKKRCVVTGRDMPVDDRGVQHNQECPLVPVPEHGRLIDADALTGQMERNLWAIEDKAEKELGFDETLRIGMQYGYAVCLNARVCRRRKQDSIRQKYMVLC